MPRVEHQFSFTPPQNVQSIIHKLTEAGFEAYLAGGSVRDILLGHKPKDFDIATSATPDQIESIFPQTIAVGRDFGILIVLMGDSHYEVATFRGERGHSDRRRPDEVYWTTAEQDALRRDFTVNAMFYDIDKQLVVDYTEGLIDLENKIIRFVGEPKLRVAEDYLRILRGVRLKNVLGFQYDIATYHAIRNQAAAIKTISTERIRNELDRLWLDSHRSQGLRELAELGLLVEILPEVDALRGLPQPQQFHREGDTFDHTIRSLAALPAKSPNFLVWAVLLHDVGKAQTLHYPSTDNDRLRFEGHARVGAELARQVGQRYHMPRVEIETIAWLIEHHMHLVGIDEMREARRREYLLDPRFRWLLELHHADAAGTLPRDLTLYNQVKAFYEHYLMRWHKEQERGAPPLLVTGHDLQELLGLAPSKQVGELLAEIRDAQLEGKIQTREAALELAKRLYSV